MPPCRSPEPSINMCSTSRALELAFVADVGSRGHAWPCMAMHNMQLQQTCRSPRPRGTPVHVVGTCSRWAPTGWGTTLTRHVKTAIVATATENVHRARLHRRGDREEKARETEAREVVAVVVAAVSVTETPVDAAAAVSVIVIATETAGTERPTTAATTTVTTEIVATAGEVARGRHRDDPTTEATAIATVTVTDARRGALREATVEGPTSVLATDTAAEAAVELKRIDRVPT